jgi:two-component system, cell cycle sensor histidine kinase and response regulator CckA
MSGRGVIRTMDGQGGGRLTDGDQGLEDIFLHSAISMWKEDISRLRAAVAELKRDGVTDMRDHLRAHPELITAAAGMVTVADANAATLRLFGVHTKDALLGPLSRTRQVSDPLVRDRLTALIVRLFTGSRFDRGETVVVTPGGKRLDILVETVLPAESDPYPYMHVSVIDITEQRLAEQALRDSERRLADIIDFLPDPTFAIDDGGRVIAWNKALEELTGVPAAAMRGRGDYEYALPFYGERRPLLIDLVRTPDIRIEQRYLPILRREKDLLIAEMHFSNLNGAPSWLWGKAVVLYDNAGKPVGAIETLRDITEKKRIEEALRLGEERYRSLVENLGEGITIIDSSLRFTFANPAADRMLGFTTGGLVGRGIATLLSAEGLAGIRTRMMRQTKGERDNYVQEFIRPDGMRRLVEITATPQYDGRGEYSGSFEVLHDITERTRAQEDLRQSEERYHLLLDTLHEGIWAGDAEGRTSFVNPRMAQLLGYEEEEMLGMPAVSFMDAAVLETFRRRFASLHGGTVVRDDVELVRKDGSRLIVVCKMSLLHGADGAYAGAIASVTDITEQRAAERAVRKLSEQLAEAQKMEAIGRLAGGVAHDFNNLLTTILGNVELIKGVGALPRDALELADEIEMAGMRAATVTSQLLAFGRRQMLQPRDLDVNGLIETLSKLLGRLIREDIALDLRLCRDLSTVHADPNRIEQVIINLVVNARDAMPSGGRLTLETANVTLDGSGIGEERDADPGPYVAITVSDTGMGMDEGVRSHLFEPFFTTKEMGKGTGLGLSTVYGIVRQSGGHIRVVSEPHKGSAFSVYLPAQPGRAAAVQKPRAAGSLVAGTETILLVEDEEHVLKMVSRQLRGFGYTVLGLREPLEALELDAGDCGRIDLLITDIVLPGMNGLELAERMRARMPGLHMLFVSGYADEAAFKSQIAATGAAFLPKPFSRDALARKVREVLDAD